MKYLGYCPHCGSKIIEVKNMGFFDDFSIKCWHCKKIPFVYEMEFRIDESEKIKIEQVKLSKKIIIKRER